MFDILIRHGTVIDGTGKPRHQADVGVDADRIAAVGDLAKQKGTIEVDASGMIVAPGFVDVLSHADTYWTVIPNPLQESLLRQGITTIIGGNCGASLAPLVSGDAILSIQKWANVSEANVNWATLAEFLAEFEKRPLGVNFGTLVGHGTLRRGILHDEFRAANREELARLRYMLRQALDDGALGFSTGLAYSHAKVATTEEISELVEEVERAGGIWASHIRGEAEELLPAVNETIQISRETGAAVEISHFKAMGKVHWPNFASALNMVENAREDGLNITFDCYPYTITGSVLYTVLPDWVEEGGRRELVKRLRDPSVRVKVMEEMRKSRYYEYENVRVAISTADPAFAGKTIAQIAREQGVSGEEAVMNMLLAAEGRVVSFMDTLSEENVRAALKHPLSFVASDGAGYRSEDARKGFLVHPRSFGAFPRFLAKYVREEKLVTWEEGIRKITAGPAAKYKLAGRGLLAKRYFADMVVFDPETIRDRATFENPFQYPEGIQAVIVNGKIAVAGGELTGAAAGTVLKRR